MDVRLIGTFAAKSPLSHIGESIGTTTYLVQEPIVQPDGSVAEVFSYSGNAWRGQLRDLAAAYLLDAIGSPRIGLDSFHLLFAGGAIGGEQQVNLGVARAWRRTIPMIAVWGGGIGNQILPGKMRVGNSYPVCTEANPVLLEHRGTVSYRAMTMEKSFSRMDDAKSPLLSDAYLAETIPALQQGELLATEKPAKADKPAQQMRVTVELLSPGAVLETWITLQEVSEVELGCLVSALHRFARSPHIGGQANKGHGLVDLAYDIIDLDTGERQPFLAVVSGGIALAPPADDAKRAYDAHCLDLYNAMLAESGGEIAAMLKAA